MVCTWEGREVMYKRLVYMMCAQEGGENMGGMTASKKKKKH